MNRERLEELVQGKYTKLCPDLQKATGWSQEYIETLGFIRFMSFRDHSSESIGQVNLVKWLSSMDTTQLYFLSFMGKLPCAWRGVYSGTR